MKEPGLDGRHRDKSPPKAGEIQQKRSDTLNKKSIETDPSVCAQRDSWRNEGEDGQG